MSDPLEPHRPRLLGLAYRMLGDRAEAEDVLQDAFIRFAGAREVDHPAAFLTTTVTRLCLERLKIERSRRESYVGPWLPDPVLDAAALAPDATTEFADDISFALMLTLERLSPAERAAFLLHDVFDLSFRAVSAALGRSEAACRQLAARARKAVRGERQREKISPHDHARIIQAFFAAVRSGDLAGLTAVLREDAVMITDAGGAGPAALKPIRSASNIARLVIRGTRKFGAMRPSRISHAAINGMHGLIAYRGDRPDQAIAFEFAGSQIAAIYVVRSPAKLARLH
jgi:RNA polymerase sigma-70 factor (ECF subfamily)